MKHKGASAASAVQNAKNVFQDRTIASCCYCLYSNPILSGMRLQESKGKCSAISRKLASFKTLRNASRDFRQWVKLPLASCQNTWYDVCCRFIIQILNSSDIP